MRGDSKRDGWPEQMALARASSGATSLSVNSTGSRSVRIDKEERCDEAN
jgi:hypothetical protein